LEVRDFDTAGLLDATKAFFVEGSDVSPCTAKRSSPTDERGCCMKTLYDRCLPSLLAFGTRQAAEGFTQRHGGKVKTLAEIERFR
jgi:nitrous oxide reductase accessory protein NosL